MNALSNLSFGGLLETESLMEAGMAAAGGAVTGLGYSILAAKVKWFSEGSGNVQLGKRIGLAAALGFGAGFVLWDAAPDAAKGAFGAAGARIAELVALKIDPSFVAKMPALAGYGGGGLALPAYEEQSMLQGTVDTMPAQTSPLAHLLGGGGGF